MFGLDCYIKCSREGLANTENGIGPVYKHWPYSFLVCTSDPNWAYLCCDLLLENLWISFSRDSGNCVLYVGRCWKVLTRLCVRSRASHPASCRPLWSRRRWSQVFRKLLLNRHSWWQQLGMLGQWFTASQRTRRGTRSDIVAIIPAHHGLRRLTTPPHHHRGLPSSCWLLWPRWRFMCLYN